MKSGDGWDLKLRIDPQRIEMDAMTSEVKENLRLVRLQRNYDCFEPG
jgi:hypothetical protein